MPKYNHSEDVRRLKILRKDVNFEIEKERYNFLRQLTFSIWNWKNGQLRILLEILKPEEIERLLSDSIKRDGNSLFISIVARSGYKDEPKLDTDWKPILLRTTPVHHAARFGYAPIVKELFTVYNRFDLNYTDESGLTHFQAACHFGCNDVAKKFFEFGQDPNGLALQSANPLLHMALWHGNKEMAELLLRAGADPNLANEDGLTPLHFIAQKNELHGYSSVNMLIELSHDRCKAVRVNARDKRGQTPLHYAVTDAHKFYTVKALLYRGANPNLVDMKGLTPLHVICNEKDDGAWAETFFKINDELSQLVKIDAQDKLGRTPLQWAVASFKPDIVNTLLNKGADLSRFVFPTESHFDEYFETHYRPSEWTWHTLEKLANIVKSLEDKGYEFNGTDILTIMKIFAKLRLFKKTPYLDERLRSSKEYVDWSKNFTLISSLTKLHDFMQLPLEEAKKLFTFQDYLDVKRSSVWGKLDEELGQACILHLCEILFRRFFRPWAMEFFLELTQYQLPILCCEKIFDTLMNEDFWRIYLAATDQSS